MIADERRPDTLEAIVREAWRLTLPDAPADARTSWAESGGDSLGALHLVLRLEARLGRRVPLELITTEVTIPVLAQRLKPPEKAPPRGDLTVFLVPGYLGHSATWPQVRQGLEPAVTFDTAAVPDLESAAADLADLAWSAQRVAEDIMRRAPSGALALTGFSFGACVAQEAARVLVSRGREVARVVLLDPWIPEADPGDAAPARRADASRARHLLPRPGEGPFAYLHWLAFVALIHLGARDLGRQMLRASSGRLEPADLLRRRAYFLRRVRFQALKNWRPQPLRAPVLLVVSDQHAQGQQMAIWQGACPDHELVRVPGRHIDVIGRDAADRLVPILRAAYAAAAASAAASATGAQADQFVGGEAVPAGDTADEIGRDAVRAQPDDFLAR